jgi:hypothetical protein
VGSVANVVWLRLCRAVSSVAIALNTYLAEWKKIGKKGKISSTFSLAEKNS